MKNPPYPQTSAALARKRCERAPGPSQTFETFSAGVFAEGAPPAQVEHPIAVAAAHVTPYAYCIKGYTAKALKRIASGQQVMQASWAATGMPAGGAYAHPALALDVMQQPAHSGAVG